MRPRKAVTAGGIVIKAIGDQLKIALARDPAEGERAWIIPKGHVHDGESLATAAVREIRDEVGIQEPVLLHYLGFISRLSVEDWGETVQKEIHLFLAYAPGPADIKPAEFETVTEAAWWAPKDALKVIPFQEDKEFLVRELRLLFEELDK